MLYAPTGAGKGVIAASLAASAVSKGKRVLILTPKRELVDDLSGRLDKIGVEHGVIQAGHWRVLPWCPVQVASVSTLARREKPAASLVIVDECQHATCESWNAIVDAYPGAIIVGLSATPCRLSGKPLGDIFDDMVAAATPSELVDLGFLVPVTGFAYSAPDLSGVHITGGDYNGKELGQRVNTRKLVGNLADEWAKHARGLKTIVFACNVEHSRGIVERFIELGVKAEHVDGAMPKKERAAVFERFRAGSTQVVSNVMVFTEGIDIADIACVVLARPTASMGLAIQMIGRGRRPVPCACGQIPHWRNPACACGRPVSKRALRVHDHARIVESFGLPDQDREWSLDADFSPAARKSNGPAISVRTCARCFACYSPDLPACPLCGSVNPKRSGEIKEVEGEAVPLEKVKVYAQASADRKRDAYRWMLKDAKEQGHKPGAAAHRFRARYGHWPSPGWGAQA